MVHFNTNPHTACSKKALFMIFVARFLLVP